LVSHQKGSTTALGVRIYMLNLFYCELYFLFYIKPSFLGSVVHSLFHLGLVQTLLEPLAGEFNPFMLLSVIHSFFMLPI
jgi:hypothetical protein